MKELSKARGEWTGQRSQSEHVFFLPDGSVDLSHMLDPCAGISVMDQGRRRDLWFLSLIPYVRVERLLGNPIPGQCNSRKHGE